MVLRLCSNISEESFIQHLIRRKPDTWEPETDEDEWDMYHPGPYSWMTSTQVCRAWRQIALGDSQIWSHVSITSPEMTAEMFKRAGPEVPLTVTCSITCDLTYDETSLYRSIGLAQAFVSTHIARIQTLVVPAISDFLGRTEATQAVRLQRLIFVEPSTIYVSLRNPTGPPFQFPALNELRTTAQLSGSFTHLFAPTLRTLVLRHRTNMVEEYAVRFEPFYATSAQELAAALQNLPLLEVLDVDLSHKMEAAPDEVALPRLRTLRLVGPTAVCAALFQALHISRDVRTELRCISEDVNDGQAADATPALMARVLSDPTAIDTTRFGRTAAAAVTRAGASGWRISAWRNTDNIRPPADVTVVLPVRVDEQDVRAVLAACPLHETERVLVWPLGWHLGPGTVDLARAVAALPRLRKLMLQHFTQDMSYDLLERTTANKVVYSKTEFNQKACAEDRETMRLAGVYEVCDSSYTTDWAFDFQESHTTARLKNSSISCVSGGRRVCLLRISRCFVEKCRRRHDFIGVDRSERRSSCSRSPESALRILTVQPCLSLMPYYILLTSGCYDSGHCLEHSRYGLTGCMTNGGA